MRSVPGLKSELEMSSATIITTHTGITVFPAISVFRASLSTIASRRGIVRGRRLSANCLSAVEAKSSPVGGAQRATERVISAVMYGGSPWIRHPADGRPGPTRRRRRSRRGGRRRGGGGVVVETGRRGGGWPLAAKRGGSWRRRQTAESGWTRRQSAVINGDTEDVNPRLHRTRPTKTTRTHSYMPYVIFFPFITEIYDL